MYMAKVSDCSGPGKDKKNVKVNGFEYNYGLSYEYKDVIRFNFIYPVFNRQKPLWTQLEISSILSIYM